MGKAELRALAEAAMKTAKVVVIAEGETALNLTDREWSRYNQDYVGGKTVNELISQRDVIVDHMGRERVRNGLGEWVA